MRRLVGSLQIEQLDPGVVVPGEWNGVDAGVTADGRKWRAYSSRDAMVIYYQDGATARVTLASLIEAVLGATKDPARFERPPLDPRD